jgi:predicted transcriptional regulator
MRTKEKLIEKILHIDDESILEEIMQMVDLELDLVGDTVKLTPEQKAFIDEGIKDIDEGRYISHEESKKRTKEWLKGQ